MAQATREILGADRPADALSSRKKVALRWSENPAVHGCDLV